jgi:hypothetical protein
MESFLKYKNRVNLYQFLIDDFGMKKVYDNYDLKNFGNFCVKLALDDFLFSYIKDRNILDIYIENKMKPDEAFPLSFLMNYLYNPHCVNNYEIQDNKNRIEKLNEFIRRDFNRIRVLINTDNYINTKSAIDKLLKEQFLTRNPNSII